jgi:hypothetical protein
MLLEHVRLYCLLESILYQLGALDGPHGKGTPAARTTLSEWLRVDARSLMKLQDHQLLAMVSILGAKRDGQIDRVIQLAKERGSHLENLRFSYGKKVPRTTLRKAVVDVVRIYERELWQKNPWQTAQLLCERVGDELLRKPIDQQ